MKCWTQILESWGANNVMWSQWFFFWFSIWHVYVEAFREYHKCFELQILNLIDRKMQKSSWTPAWNACMIVCVRCGVGPGARRFCSHSVWSVPTLVCPRRSVQICSNGRCYYLLTLHWVSSTPHTANRRETTPSMEGRWWQFMCTCLLKDLMDLCFYFCKKNYLPYSGFYCGIIQYKVCHWVLHHFVPPLQKRRKKCKKNVKKKKLQKQKIGV